MASTRCSNVFTGKNTQYKGAYKNYSCGKNMHIVDYMKGITLLDKEGEKS